MGTVVPLALSSTTAHAGVPSAEATQHTVDGLAASGVFRPSEPDDGTGPDWLSTAIGAHNGDVLIVMTPGTDDGTLYPRLRGFRTGDKPTYIIDYPESIGPIIGGRSDAALPIFAPTYDQSRDVAITKNLAAMRAFATQQGANPFVVYTGYSQGAEALGNAAEQAVAANEDGPSIDVERSHIVLISDPRSPWGLKAWAADHAAVAGLMEMFGAESNGARDPEATGDLPVTSVIVVGDPVANFQWASSRPVSSLLVNAAGFITIHTGLGEQNYGNLIDYSQEPTVLRSADGNTTYLVYTPKHHPLTALAVLVNSRLGIAVDDDDVARWDSVNNAFYPLQAPGVQNAAVDVVDPTAAARMAPTDLPSSASRAAAENTETPVPATLSSDTEESVGEQQLDAVQPSTRGRHRAPEQATTPPTLPTTSPAAPTVGSPQITDPASQSPAGPQAPAGPQSPAAPPTQSDGPRHAAQTRPDAAEDGAAKDGAASEGGRHAVTGQGRHAAENTENAA
ncbi:PE-PPE domain-containing protein [Gordonia jacobaea]|uniref:PE-PPE domain-containing protein n=1 Tax=Gordonia jacobaea TaxID=122202 RepID=UPI003D743B9C